MSMTEAPAPSTFDGILLDQGGAYVNVRSHPFNAKGDGVTKDDASRIQDAIDYAQDNGRKVYIPAGTYLLSKPLCLTRDKYNNNHFAIQGEFASTLYMGQARPGPSPQAPYGTGTILMTMDPGQDAIQTIPASPPLSTNWTNFVELRDLYVMGPAAVSQPPAGTGSVGFNLQGVFFGKFHNLRAEGFGTGLLLSDASECWFTGLTFMENNFYGAWLQRSDIHTDLQAWFENLVTDNNQQNLVMDCVRSVWIEKGENIALYQTAAYNNIYVRNSDNTQIKIRNYTLETQAYITGYNPDKTAIRAPDNTVLPPITVDATGVSLLSIDGLNWETVPKSYCPSLIECAGWFDRIEVRDSALPRALLIPGTVQAQPLVRISTPGSQGNTVQRSMQVVLEGNAPAIADTWVLDESGGTGASPYRDALHDAVPGGYVQVNPRPQMDQANDNRITVSAPPLPDGTPGYAFTDADPLAGHGRLYWIDASDQNTVTLTFPRPLRGVWTIYVTMIAYVGPSPTPGTPSPWIPKVKALGGVGQEEASWMQQGMQLEQYVVGETGFTKIAVTASVTAPQGPLASITVGPFYGGSTAYGLETLNVYVDGRQTGTVDPGDRMRDSAPAAATDGMHVPGDRVYNASPAPGQPLGWVCTARGAPGSWSAFGVLS